jgi:hypothetical protein
MEFVVILLLMVGSFVIGLIQGMEFGGHAPQSAAQRRNRESLEILAAAQTIHGMTASALAEMYDIAESNAMVRAAETDMHDDGTKPNR